MTQGVDLLESRMGAVAMIDALGFRGVWRRFSPEEVVGKLQSLADATCSEARELQTDARAHGGNLLEFVRVTALSDTIVFGVATKALDLVTQGLKEEGWGEIFQFDNDLLAGEAVRIAAELLGGLLRKAIEPPVPLAYRGAIAFGQFGMTDRFVIGPAIDEAADWMDKADGAVVVLTPSAAKYPQAGAPSSISSLFECDVPMHPTRCSSSVLRLMALSPLAGVDSTDQRAKFRTHLVEAFGPSPAGDVLRKLNNTQAFLDAADAAERRPLEELLAHARNPF